MGSKVQRIPVTTSENSPAKASVEKKNSSKPAAVPSDKANDKAKKKRRVRKEIYSRYIYKVLKQVHPDTAISSKSVSILNSFMNDIFEQISCEASKIAAYNHKSTISSREIQTAVRLIFPDELGQHAM